MKYTNRLPATAMLSLLLLPGLAFAADQVRSYQVKGFENVEVSNGIGITLLQDSNISLKMTGAPSQLDRLDIRTNGNTLHIGFKPLSGLFSGPVTAQLTMPLLSGLRLSGGSQGEIRFDARNTSKLSLELSGGSGLKGTVIAKSASIEASGGSMLKIEGFSEDLTLEASGGSRNESPEFATGNATLALSGGSYAKLAVQNQLTVEASGGSEVHYKGTPKLRSNSSGGSTVTQDD